MRASARTVRQARLVSFAVGCILWQMKPAGLFLSLRDNGQWRIDNGQLSIVGRGAACCVSNRTVSTPHTEHRVLTRCGSRHPLQGRVGRFDGPNSLLQGRVGRFDGPNPPLQGRVSRFDEPNPPLQGRVGRFDGPNSLLQGRVGRFDGPNPLLRGCKGRFDGPNLLLHGFWGYGDSKKEYV